MASGSRALTLTSCLRHKMNLAQKILTFLATAALSLSAFNAPWDLFDTVNQVNTTQYAPLFRPPDLTGWSRRELVPAIFWMWALVAVIYGALFAALRSANPVAKPESDTLPK